MPKLVIAIEMEKFDKQKLSKMFANNMGTLSKAIKMMTGSEGKVTWRLED